MTFKNAAILGILVFIISFLGTRVAYAENTYIAGSYSMIDIDGLTDHTGYKVIVGQQFNDLVGIEGYALVASSTEGYSGANVDIDQLWGINLIIGLPVNDDTYVYALLGHAEAEATASYMGYSESADRSSTSYGFGVRHELLEQYTLRVEYSQPVDDVDSLDFIFQLNF